MRVGMIAAAAACVVLGACGGPQTSQANNTQANISNDASLDTAAPSMVHNASLATGKVDIKGVMHARHEGMETIGKTTKTIKRELGGSTPNIAAVRAGAAQIADLSRKASGWFPAGTGPEAGKTGAKPAIWQNPEDFASKLHNFQVAAAAFTQAAMSPDVNAIKTKFGALGQTCKACHDKYRSEMHH
jgi:cytochrome c556